MANQFHYSRLTKDNRILWGGYDAVYFAGGRIKQNYEDRMESHRKLEREAIWQESRTDVRLRNEQKQMWARRSREARTRTRS
jgi:hypothetical protein